MVLAGQSEYHQMGLSCKVQAFIMQVAYLQINMWSTMTVVIMHRVITTGSPKFHGAKMLGLKLKYWVHLMCWVLPVVLTTILSLLDDDVFHENIWGQCSGGAVFEDAWATENGVEPRTCQQLFDFATGKGTSDADATKLMPDDPSDIYFNSNCAKGGEFEVPPGIIEDYSVEDGEGLFSEEEGAVKQLVSTATCIYKPSELNGIGWCSIHSKHRIFKAFFFNLPQLIVVSFYAQYYYYIHQIVDPDKVGDVSGALGATKISTSGRSGMMSTADQLRKEAQEKAAEQQRLYMLVYMMSFLVNTLMQLLGDNMSSSAMSTSNLTVQALLVTPQGFFVGLIYMRNAKSLFASYSDALANYLGSKNPDQAAAYKEKRLKMKVKQEEMREKRAARAAAFKAGKGSIFPKIKNVLWVGWNVALMLPVAVWVWTPMEFLGEFVNTSAQMLLGLIIWGFALVFPFYFFSVGRLLETPCLNVWTLTNPASCVQLDDGTCADENSTCEWQYFYVAQIYLIFITILSSLGVYKNRYAHHLLFTEGPIRREGFLSSVGNGLRLNSLRNVMGVFTGTLEFYQTYGLTWGASQMGARYQGQSATAQFNELQNEDNVVVNETDVDEMVDVSVTNHSVIHNATTWGMNLTETDFHLRTMDHATFLEAMLPADPRSIANGCDADSHAKCCNQMGTGMCQEEFMFWAVIYSIGGWTFLYCLPSVINTTTVGNRQLSLNLQEIYRKYLWFMAGAGFLTILKALIKVQFCLPFGSFNLFEEGTQILGPDGAILGTITKDWGPLVSLSDPYVQCYSAQHLQMIAIACSALCIFFPSASLTCLFRYDEDDDRGCLGNKKEGEEPFEKGFRYGGCNAGGEDLRWCHLWRRIEYIVKVIWVSMGYRLQGRYGSIAALVLFGGSALIVFVNGKMEPANLRVFNRWKFYIHSSNVWTTTTCLMAVAFDWDSKIGHYAILIPGWMLIGIAIVVFEKQKIDHDVFHMPAESEETLALCKKETRDQRRNIAFSKGVHKWDTHQRIVRLLRLCEHSQVAVSRDAFQCMATLAYMDQMTAEHSFFLCVTPVNPTVMTTFHPIMTSDDDDQRNAAVQFMTIVLQMNIGNRVAKPCTFHELVMVHDDGGQVGDGFFEGNGLMAPKNLPTREMNGLIKSLCKYATSDIPRAHKFDAAALIMEMCNADSNKLVFVADTMLPLLSEWMTSGSVLEQHLAVHLVAMVSNRFDAAQKVIDSDAVEATISLFNAVYSIFGTFDDSADADSFAVGQAMPSSLTLPGRQLPKALKREFVIPELPATDISSLSQESDESDDVIVADTFDLNPEQQLKLEGDILHYCMQAIVELAGASRAVGRRQLLEAGALEVITKCLDANRLFEERGLYGRFGVDSKSSVMRVRLDLMHEACSACHGFLAGRFGLHDMELDEEFDKPYKSLQAWKEEMIEEKDFETTREFEGLGPVQRRKLHIVCAFLQLPHNSIGGIGARSVVAGPVKDPSAVKAPPADKAETVKEGAKSAMSAIGGAMKGAIDKKVKPDWMDPDKVPEDEVYEWCWKKTCEAHGENVSGLTDQMIALHKGTDDGVRQTPPSTANCHLLFTDRVCFLFVCFAAQLKFHAVDLLLKIVEHGLDLPENRAELFEIFQ